MDDVVKNFMTALSNTQYRGNDALYQAIRSCSRFGNIQDAINNLVNDCRNAGSVSNFLINSCGIILDNEDTGAITGLDAGGDTVKTAYSVVPESGNIVHYTGTRFNKNGLTINVPSQDQLTENQKIIVNGIYTWWAEEGLKLIQESYGYSFTDGDATVREITLNFFNDASGSIAETGWHIDGGGNTTSLSLNINTAYFYGMDSSNPNGVAQGTSYFLDRTIAHELTHALMAAKVYHYDEMPCFIKEGVAEAVHGIDDEKRGFFEYFQNQTTDAFADNLSSWLNVDKTEHATSEEYVAGYIFMRYLNKQGENYQRPVVAGSDNSEAFYANQESSNYYMLGGNDTLWTHANNLLLDGGFGDDYFYNAEGHSNLTVVGGAGNDSVFNHSNGVIVYGEEGNEYISNFSANVTISGGNGNDEIFNNREYCNNVVIEGGSGNDYIVNSASNVTISGGTGDDEIYFRYKGSNLFNYNVGDGFDSIYGLANGDTVKVNGADYYTTTSGNNVFLHVNDATVLLYGAADQSLYFTN